MIHRAESADWETGKPAKTTPSNQFQLQTCGQRSVKNWKLKISQAEVSGSLIPIWIVG